MTLGWFRKITTRLFRRVLGCEKLDSIQLPETTETGVREIGGGEEDVGVEKNDVHALVESGWLSVRNVLGFESHLAHFGDRRGVVLFVDCRGEQEFRAPLG